MKTTTAAVIMLAIIATTHADDRKRERNREHHNYIIERQTAGQVSGVPIMQRIRGGRKIDIYSDGSMFEKNNLVGVKK